MIIKTGIRLFLALISFIIYYIVTISMLYIPVAT
jgi:hypothetical protein